MAESALTWFKRRLVTPIEIALWLPLAELQDRFRDFASAAICSFMFRKSSMGLTR